MKQEDGTKQLVDAPKRVKRWWRIDGSGNCYLILRYGNKLIAPTADKGAIAVGEKAKLVTVLDAVIAAVKAGELDAAIETAKARGTQCQAQGCLIAFHNRQRTKQPARHRGRRSPQGKGLNFGIPSKADLRPKVGGRA